MSRFRKREGTFEADQVACAVALEGQSPTVAIHENGDALNGAET